MPSIAVSILGKINGRVDGSHDPVEPVGKITSTVPAGEVVLEPDGLHTVADNTCTIRKVDDTAHNDMTRVGSVHCGHGPLTLLGDAAVGDSIPHCNASVNIADERDHCHTSNSYAFFIHEILTPDITRVGGYHSDRAPENTLTDGKHIVLPAL